MGAAARTRVKANHDPDQHMEKLLGLYRGSPLPRSFCPSPPHRRPRARAAASASPSLGVAAWSPSTAASNPTTSRLATNWPAWGTKSPSIAAAISLLPQIQRTHNGMRVRALADHPLQASGNVVHTLLSTAHAMTSDYDVVHYHCLGPALFSFLPRLAGKKTVVTVQGLDWQRGKWGRIAARILRWGEAAAVFSPDATMVVSRTLQRHYRQQYNRDTIYIPNGATLAPRRLPRQLIEWDLLAGQLRPFPRQVFAGKKLPSPDQCFRKPQPDMKLVAGGERRIESLRFLRPKLAPPRIRPDPFPSLGLGQ
jgi:hypothetical protein